VARGRTLRTPKKDDKFFVAVVATGGNVTKACAVAGYSRRSIYEYREKDEEFAKHFREALDKGVESLEHEAARRAHRGVNEPVYYEGERVGLKRKYSDTLLIFLLKAHKPDKYRERLGIDFANATPEQVEAAILAMPLPKLRGMLARLDKDNPENAG